MKLMNVSKGGNKYLLKVFVNYSVLLLLMAEKPETRLTRNTDSVIKGFST